MNNSSSTWKQFKQFLQHAYVAGLLRVILGVVLIYAGSLKIFDMASFANDLENYRMLPIGVINLISITLPPIEIILGICFITGFMMDGALTITTALFIVFYAAVQQALIRGLNIDCGCFGTATGSTIGLMTLMRNTAMLLAVVPVWMRHLNRDAVDEESIKEVDDPLHADIEARAGDGA